MHLHANFNWPNDTAIDEYGRSRMERVVARKVQLFVVVIALCSETFPFPPTPPRFLALAPSLPWKFKGGQSVFDDKMLNIEFEVIVNRGIIESGREEGRETSWGQCERIKGRINLSLQDRG